LKRVNELTEGKSLKSNISLVHNNAMVGARIACELAKLKA
jgi:pseudouridine-5'-phosphate glycosidase